jgi:hypothetical protein
MKESENMLVWVTKMVLLLYVRSVLLRLVKAQQSCAPEREHCKKYDLTAGSLFLIGQS